MGTPRCPFQLSDEGLFLCDLPAGHEGQHIAYCADGESFDARTLESGMEKDYVYELVRYSVYWPDASPPKAAKKGSS